MTAKQEALDIALGWEDHVGAELLAQDILNYAISQLERLPDSAEKDILITQLYV